MSCSYLRVIATLSLFATLAFASASLASFTPRPLDRALRRRQSTNTSSLQLDLGCSIYEGFYNESSGVNEGKGIRYAAPIDDLRWQAPQTPAFHRSSIIPASVIPNQYPQASTNYGTETNSLEESNSPSASEDFLYLNISTPAKTAQSLPVFVRIHGDLSPIIRTNNDNSISVSFQYRLGAFGFLASDEVNRFGVTNVGIRDQTFALQWVQSYIHLFDRNASQVTIAEESAGAGSVMLQTMAHGGTLGTFSSLIYNDLVPRQSYYAFAEAAGCLSGYAFGSPADAEPCIHLRIRDICTWGFLPVTDGKSIQQLPSEQLQLQKKQVNVLTVLSGIQEVFPLFTEDDVSRELQYYPGSNATDTMSSVDYATSGYTGTTAINNVYAETIFIYPSDWLAEAYTGNGHEAWTDQYSVPSALHGTDVSAYFGPGSIPNHGPEFIRAFMTVFGNFIMQDNPSISTSIAAGKSSTLSSNTSHSIIDWLEGGRGMRCDFWRSMGSIVPEQDG
ncbi:carboxylesterase type B [Rhexocercosporidium sp. MPI-PUGE-AT-0058]|nr:carboxylesterase type B [Rhexocercosporidium sp. MPI-PUGE-AT-0058]